MYTFTLLVLAPSALLWKGYRNAPTTAYLSEEEVTKRKVCRAHLWSCIEALEDGAGNIYEDYIRCIREDLVCLMMSLADVNLSETKINEFRMFWCRESAIDYLESRLRTGIAGGNYDYFVEQMREELYKGKLTLADIGTDEEEIVKLRPLNQKSHLRRLAQDVKTSSGRLEVMYSELFQEAAKTADPRILIELAEEGTVKIVVFAHHTTPGIFGEKTAKHLAGGIAPHDLLALLDMELIEIDGILCDF